MSEVREVFQVRSLPCHFVDWGKENPLRLDSGAVLESLTISYQTYGQMNADKSNAILVCHALTGDQFAAELNPVTGKPGWWSGIIGPGLPLDTNRFYIICANVLGGCMGTTGPKDINPATGKPYGLGFPIITIADMVHAQKRLIDHLGIQKLFAVIGGSMGGMQVLEWAVQYPEQVYAAIPIACSVQHTAQNIAFHEIGRQAIMADPDWEGGDYYPHDKIPKHGLAIARMTAHVTYLSESAMNMKFGRRLQGRDRYSFGFDADFQVESYLRYQGSSFVKRFDANSYLYITRAMDYFDLAAGFEGDLRKAFHETPVRYCVVSFTGDWLFPTSESKRIVHALNSVAADVSFVEIESDKGHDAFLLNEPEFSEILRGFLGSCAQKIGLKSLAPPQQPSSFSRAKE